jgi:hypothetical protein
MQEMKSALISEHESCRTANESVSGADRAPCGEKFSADWNRNVQDRWKEGGALAIAYTLIPVPIVWLVVYGLVAIIRKRGRLRRDDVGNGTGDDFRAGIE